MVKKEEIKGLSFPIQNIDFNDKRPITDIFPELAMYPDFNFRLNGVVEGKVFCYVALMCDLNSPFKSESDIMKKKTEIATLCEFDRTKDGKSFIEPYLNIMTSKGVDINLWFIRYCRMQGDMQWATLCIYREDYYTTLNRLPAITEEKEKKDSLANLAHMRKAMLELMTEFTVSNVSAELNNFIYRYMDFEQISTVLTPEAIVFKLREGIDPTEEWNPYKKKKK